MYSFWSNIFLISVMYLNIKKKGIVDTAEDTNLKSLSQLKKKGAPAGIRTQDLWINSPSPSPLGHRDLCCECVYNQFLQCLKEYNLRRFFTPAILLARIAIYRDWSFADQSIINLLTAFDGAKFKMLCVSECVVSSSNIYNLLSHVNVFPANISQVDMSIWHGWWGCVAPEFV